MSGEPARIEQRRVRVWFGEHVIADYTAEPKEANDYEKGMRRRFAGLRVTNDQLNVSSQ